MDLSKLTIGDKVIVGSSAAYLIAMFLPWFTFDFAGQSFRQNGWDYVFTGIVPMLIGFAMVAWIAVTKLSDVELPEIPIPEGLLLLVMGGLATLLVLVRLLIGAGDDPADLLDRSFGLVLAVLAAIGLAAGAFLRFGEDGGQLPTGGSKGNGSSTPPTPF
jgi:peptidoglycan biosynthesis protein MviN/MurJ (putative lipid II flippase)